jgi:hypothetical protein
MLTSKIHLSLPNAYKLICVLIEILMEIEMLNFWDVINCLCNSAWILLYLSLVTLNPYEFRMEFSNLDYCGQ